MSNVNHDPGPQQAPQNLFPVGSTVFLKRATGPPGQVKGVRRCYILVRFPEMVHVTRHRPDALVLATGLVTQGGLNG